MIKDIDEHPDGRGTCGKLGGKCVQHPRSVQVPLSQLQNLFTNPETSWNLCFWDFTEASSQRHDQSSTSFAALLLSQEKGERSSTPLTQETTRFSEALCQELGAETNVHIFHYFINTLPWNIQNLSKRHVAHRYLFKKYLFWLCGVLVVACEFF